MQKRRTIYNTSAQFTLSTSLHYFNFIPREYSKDIAVFEGLRPADTSQFAVQLNFCFLLARYHIRTTNQKDLFQP